MVYDTHRDCAQKFRIGTIIIWYCEANAGGYMTKALNSPIITYMLFVLFLSIGYKAMVHPIQQYDTEALVEVINEHREWTPERQKAALVYLWGAR